jgi:penicillin-binding protein 1A
VAGKTGTTNDEKDAWFVGFTADLAVGVYMGYDKPRHLGRGATGGHISAPIVKDFLKTALADKPATEFRVPTGIKLIRVDVKTGQRATLGTERAILEAFKPGTAPPDTGLGGYENAGSADTERAVRAGVTSGLY